MRHADGMRQAFTAAICAAAVRLRCAAMLQVQDAPPRLRQAVAAAAGEVIFAAARGVPAYAMRESRGWRMMREAAAAIAAVPPEVGRACASFATATRGALPFAMPQYTFEMRLRQRCFAVCDAARARARGQQGEAVGRGECAGA